MSTKIRLARTRAKIMAFLGYNRRKHIQLQAGDSDGGASKRCFILELPAELLFQIIGYLSMLPEACLALTCKRLFSICAIILDSTPLHKRWQACSVCLKLHPRASFASKELRRKAEERSCDLGNLGGLIDLCPCKKLTFRDTTDLINLLKEHFSWHSCTHSYGTTQLKIELFPELDEADQLKIRTSYQLCVEPGQLGKDGHLTWRLGCAHLSIDLWLAVVCQSSALSFYDSSCRSCTQMHTCSICNTKLAFPRRRPVRVKTEPWKDLYSFWTERCLGGASPVPDHAWIVQRIHPAQFRKDERDGGELSPWTVPKH
ncbi:hypothetical protein BO78DRAFT_405547 [Aspergillus sclerotiicarbonarius CBS 121057]|uniref:F-box domain-containing protein n=1 Tax=Aspergillus sclerotiicarbonarius (strain CBS 121057 / IBT 28362) TaxID=1448318 RepID=A0A319EPX2_ASPSB|nr:hypothetical protein BO78DRAFT_405547 [Aspergillus sclerotiicarbonarius CBS 121057]